MLSVLSRFNRSTFFWVGLIVTCLALEGAALFYQYVLEYGPCVLCVHIRAWVLGIMLAAVLGLFLRHSRFGLVLANAATLLFTAGMVERSYRTLGTERGWFEGTCSMNPNYPAWLRLDEWLPAVFKPLEACGYTPWVIPELLSMAEALMLFSVGLAAVMLFLLLGSLLHSDE